VFAVGCLGFAVHGWFFGRPRLQAVGENPKTMSGTKKITMWIQWSDEDGAFIGYCPEFFPCGAVCHGHTEAKTVTKLARLVRQELEERGELPHRLPKQRKGQASRWKASEIRVSAWAVR
jgi:predicted RNase H-like HicB family nuclease